MKVTVGGRVIIQPVAVQIVEKEVLIAPEVVPIIEKTEQPYLEVIITQQAPDEYETYELIPTNSVRNNQAYVLAKVIASMYRKPAELRTWGNLLQGEALLTLDQQYRVNFRMVMQFDSIRFFLIVPKEKAGEIIRKAEGVYDSNITIEKVENLPGLDPSNVICTEVGQRKHSIFSLETDRTNNYPLPSLLTAVRALEKGDIAMLDILIEPYDRFTWYRDAKKAHNMLENGYVPAGGGMANGVLRAINDSFNKTRIGIGRLTRFTKEQQADLTKYIKEGAQQREAGIMLTEMKPQTKRKQGDDVVAACIRIAVQSDSVERARGTAHTLANGWKDISADNDLDRFDVPDKWNARYLAKIEGRHPFSIRFKKDLYSTEEAGKFLQLPGRELIAEFPQINARKLKDTQIPEELLQGNIKALEIGTVTERGVKRKVRIPLEAFPGVVQSAVYDALCTTTFVQGKQGSGKTVFGGVMAGGFVKAGFTVILIDTADGQMLRDFVNSLPMDYPDEKIHILNFDNHAWPIPADWADVYGRRFSAADGDEELAALEISERITARFVGFINSLSVTGDFTDRMRQYVTSCLRAITTRKGWAFLDLELAITSPAYRAELLQLPEVIAQPDVVRDLRVLQDKAEEGKEGEIINPIMSRVKTLSGTTFLANLFYQPPKFNVDGRPTLDMRKLMDNEEGGYGHTIIIQASAAWQEAQATILGFVEDKINFNAFSRIDTEQSKRKPVLKWIDEPHKVIKALEGRLAGTAVEFRKYRIKNLLTGHSIDQMGAAKDALLDGGAQVTSYKTERLSELGRYVHMFAPYSNPAELYEALPEKIKAVNAVRLPSGKTCPAFLADMTPPPAFVKDRTYAWQQGAERYGRPWKDVAKAIQDKRAKYLELDSNWLDQKAAEADAAKAAADAAKVTAKALAKSAASNKK